MRRIITLAALAALIGLGGMARRSEAQFAVTIGNPYNGQGVTIGNGVNYGGYVTPYNTTRYVTPYGYNTYRYSPYRYGTTTVYSSGYRGVTPAYGWSNYSTPGYYYGGRRGLLGPRSGWAPYRW